MDNEPQSEQEVMFDSTPYLRLFIDKEGRWFQNGAEIIHPGIYKQFCSMLENAPDGGYRVRMGREVCKVEAEDVPFVVQRVLETTGDGLTVVLNDGSLEPFNPSAFRIGRENVPYMLVKDGKFQARFSRPAYYQLANYLVSEDDGERFFLELGGKRWPVQTENP